MTKKKVIPKYVGKAKPKKGINIKLAFPSIAFLHGLDLEEGQDYNLLTKEGLGYSQVAFCNIPEKLATELRTQYQGKNPTPISITA